ncbi:MAG: universal stress protein [Peptococcales bacterium]
MFKKILFPTSGSPISAKIAKTIVNGLFIDQNDLEITILYVLEVTPFHRSVSYQLEDKGIDSTKLALDEVRGILAKATKVFNDENIPYKIRVELGEPVETILKVADEIKCDLMVVGYHGQSSLSDYLFKGNITNELMDGANCPIMVVK